MSERALAEWTATVEAGKVREFARAVRDDHWEAKAPSPPPTFPVVLSAEFVERLVTEILPTDRSRTVHGEQEYEYLRPLKTGERVRCRAYLVEDRLRDGFRVVRNRVVAAPHGRIRLGRTEERQRPTRADAKLDRLVLAGGAGQAGDVAAQFRLDVDVPDPIAGRQQILRRDDRFQAGQRMLVLQADEHLVLLVCIRVANVDAQQEAVELGFG